MGAGGADPRAFTVNRQNDVDVITTVQESYMHVQ